MKVPPWAVQAFKGKLGRGPLPPLPEAAKRGGGGDVGVSGYIIPRSFWVLVRGFHLNCHNGDL